MFLNGIVTIFAMTDGQHVGMIYDSSHILLS